MDNSGTLTQGTTLSGTAGISGAGGLVQEAGTLVLNTTNSFSGPTSISCGTIQLSGSNSVNALENSAVTDNVANGGLALRHQRPDLQPRRPGRQRQHRLEQRRQRRHPDPERRRSQQQHDLFGRLEWQRRFRNGGGILVLTNTDTYTGKTTIAGGILVAGNTGAVPGWLTAGNVSVTNSGATFAVQGGTAGGEFSLANIGTVLSGAVSFAASANLGIQVVQPGPLRLQQRPRQYERRHAGPGEARRRSAGV